MQGKWINEDFYNGLYWVLKGVEIPKFQALSDTDQAVKRQ